MSLLAILVAYFLLTYLHLSRLPQLCGDSCNKISLHNFSDDVFYYNWLGGHGPPWPPPPLDPSLTIPCYNYPRSPLHHRANIVPGIDFINSKVIIIQLRTVCPTVNAVSVPLWTHLMSKQQPKTNENQGIFNLKVIGK